MVRKRAARYRRISKDREGREIGITRQGEDCDELSTREGLTIVADYSDNDLGASASSRKRRPGYEQMIRDAKAGKFEVIIAYSASRLTRRMRENEDLLDLAQQYGITYRFVRSPSFDLNTADGRQVARMLAAADAAEAERNAERSSRAVQQRAEQQLPHGGPRSYGIARNGRELDVEEAEAVREWARRLLNGTSLRTLAMEMNAAGKPTTTGRGKWSASTIRGILQAPRTRGLRIYKGRELPAPHEAIISRETYDALAALFAAPGRRAIGHPGPARQYLGIGLYACERCPDARIKTLYSERGVRGYVCLGCYRSWGCGDRIDAWVTEAVEGALAAEDAAERLLARQTADGPNLAALSAEAAAIRLRMVTLAEQFALAKDSATEGALGAGLAAGEKRLDEIRETLARQPEPSPVAQLLASADPVAAFRALPNIESRQAVVRRIVTVVLGAPPRGRAPYTLDVLGGSRWAGDTRTWREIEAGT